jgi:hypothetical protein
MSLYDYFDPDPPIGCHRPGCTGNLLGWQGRHSSLPCLFVWQQGVIAPVDQRVDEEIKAKLEKRSTFRLPINVVILAAGATCDKCGGFARFDIECTTNSEGLWFATKIGAKIASAKIIEQDWIQCLNCYDAWPKIEGKRLYLCPTCESVVQ